MVPLETLKAFQFLADFPDDRLRQLAEIAEIEHVPEGAVVFREGEQSPAVYLVVRGDLALELNVPTRGPMPFQGVDAGELLAWSAALGPAPLTATARARMPSTLVALDAVRLRALCASETAFGAAFLHHVARALAARLSATRLLLMNLYRETSSRMAT